MEKGLQTSLLITIGISAREREDSQLGEELRSPHAVETTYPNVSLFCFFFLLGYLQCSHQTKSLPCLPAPMFLECAAF